MHRSHAVRPDDRQARLRGRLLAGVLVPLSLAGVLAGCGDSDDSGATAKAPAATTAAAAGQSAGDTAAAGSADGSTGDHAGTDHADKPAESVTSSSGKGDAAEKPKASTRSSDARPSEVDKAFVRQMIPHHQAAIDMGKLAVRKAQHPELKRLASSMVGAQNKELAELKAMAKQLGVKSADASVSMQSDAKTLGLSMDDLGMAMKLGSLQKSKNFDTDFIAEMTPHHDGAIAMAKSELKNGKNPKLGRIATDIVIAQQGEVTQMASWTAKW